MVKHGIAFHKVDWMEERKANTEKTTNAKRHKRLSRKRFVKLLMGRGWLSKRGAEYYAKMAQNRGISYKAAASRIIGL